jgi:hypothetical protein
MQDESGFWSQQFKPGSSPYILKLPFASRSAGELLLVSYLSHSPSDAYFRFEQNSCDFLLTLCLRIFNRCRLRLNLVRKYISVVRANMADALFVVLKKVALSLGDGALTKIAAEVVEAAPVLTDFEHSVKQIEGELSVLHAFIGQVRAQKAGDRAFDAWLDQVRNVAMSWKTLLMSMITLPRNKLLMQAASSRENSIRSGTLLHGRNYQPGPVK